MPTGMVLVGKSKNYYFGARRLARGLFAVNEKFYAACVDVGVNFVDVERQGSTRRGVRFERSGQNGPSSMA